MSNGQPILIRVSVKPIPTLMKALPSVNLHEGTDAPATIVRSDVCVVPAGAIVGEAMVRLALMEPVLEKYGGDSMEETLDNFARSRDAAAALFARGKMKRHVALVGFMASGKSTIGRSSRARLRCAFFDTDELIVRAHGRDLVDIFYNEGEAAFRRYERDAVRARP